MRAISKDPQTAARRTRQIGVVLLGIISCLLVGFAWVTLSGLTPWTDPARILARAQQQQAALIAACPPPADTAEISMQSAKGSAGGWRTWETTIQFRTMRAWNEIEDYYHALLISQGFRYQPEAHYSTWDTKQYGDQTCSFIVGPPYHIIILRYATAPAGTPTTYTVIFRACVD